MVRMFDPGRHGATATTFRYYGPLKRFDHHRAKDSRAVDDAERGIYYCALDLDGCIVEIFGDAGIVEFDNWHVAVPRVNRPLRLLDLRNEGAMSAGSVAALSKIAGYSTSQEWSRYFYEHDAIYARVDGIIYFNAHNDGVALALYERAQDSLECPDDFVIRLDDRALRSEVLLIAEKNGLIVTPQPR
jgi:hypothetical protein